VTLTASNAYGSDAEVKTSYISVSSGGGGTPAISGFTGTMTHGTAVTINGADFGSKSPAAPLKWEDFEGHTNGADVLIADGWNDAVFAKYSSAATYAGTLGMHCDFSLSTNVSVRFDHAWTSEIYIDVKQRFIPSSTPTRNYKPMLLYGSCNHGLPDDNEFPQVHLYSENTCTWDGSLKTESRGGLGVSDSEYLASANGLMGSMHHMQTYMKLSTPGVADGKIFHWLDCVNRSDRTNVLNRDGVHAAEYWKQLRIGYYFAHDAIDGCPAPVGSGGAYYDDVYIDSTQARVEIGNASSYDACTFREIQIPTSWSSTQIQVTFNAGAFAQDDPAWIFVIDSNGAKSAGYFGTVQE
jgi:PKD repeat protein